LALAAEAVGAPCEHDWRVLLVLQSGRWTFYAQVSNVQACRNFPSKRIVTIHCDRSEDPVLMSGCLTFGNDDRATPDGLHKPARDDSIVDTLDQDIALSTQIGHARDSRVFGQPNHHNKAARAKTPSQ
jgi:hypothetical protein